MTPNNGMLERLYKTGTLADVSIGTETKTFQVHKAIVCMQSHVFAAAFTGKFKEAEARHVHLEEPEEMIDNLLHHLYDLEPPLLGDDLHVSVSGRLSKVPKESDEDRVGALLQLQTAADKYGVAGLAEQCSAAIRRWISLHAPIASRIELGAMLWEDECPINRAAREMAIEYTAYCLRKAVDDDSTWDALHSRKLFCREVIKRAASIK